MDLCSIIHRHHRNTSGIILLCVYFHSVNSRFRIYCSNLYGSKQKKELLSANTSPIDVDDDEYWKTGYYYNPDDKHILVENRMQSGNYTFNYAKKARGFSQESPVQ